MAEVIWRDHYPEIIGMEQVNYMLARFYSTEAMLQQMAEGQRFYRVMVDGEPRVSWPLSSAVRGIIF